MSEKSLPQTIPSHRNMALGIQGHEAMRESRAKHAAEVDARLIAAAPDLYEACTHERDTVSRLDWLSALLTEADANFSAWAGDDREAAYTALRESCELLSALRVAVAKAEGGTR